MIDSHCHLDQEPLFQDLENVIQRSKDIGIKKLLTISTNFKSFENITNNQRYFDLCNAISASRGEKYKIRISGIDELIFQHDSPLIEGCNTGFQFHLQIKPEIFHHIYILYL